MSSGPAKDACSTLRGRRWRAHITSAGMFVCVRGCLGDDISNPAKVRRYNGLNVWSGSESDLGSVLRLSTCRSPREPKFQLSLPIWPPALRCPETSS